jgi:hypothetical protein
VTSIRFLQHIREVKMNRYRVIDTAAKQPVSVMEIVGPPTEDLARGIAARTILGWSPISMHSPAFQEVMNRLVVKSIDDQFLRWVVTKVHNLFEEADGWAFEGHEVQVAEYSPDGVIVASCPISRETGRTSPLPSEYILLTARSLQGMCLGFA